MAKCDQDGCKRPSVITTIVHCLDKEGRPGDVTIETCEYHFKALGEFIHECEKIFHE